MLRTQPIKKRRSKPRRGPVRNAKYKRFVKSFPCVVCGYQYSDPAHTVNNGMRSKGSDLECIPLCRWCHEEFDHGKAGKKAFIERHRLDIPAITKWLNERFLETGSRTPESICHDTVLPPTGFLRLSRGDVVLK